MIPAKIFLGVSGKNGVLRGQLSPRIYDLVREMPGRRKWQHPDLLFEMTAANIEFLTSRLPNAELSPEFKARLDEVMAVRQDENKLIEGKAKEIDLSKKKEFPFATDPFDHQFQAFMLSKDSDYFGLFMEMGTGKTKVEIDRLCYAYSIGKIDTLFVAAPNGVHRQWIREQLPEHMWKGIEYAAEYYESGASKKHQNKINEVYNAKDILRIIAINIEALSHKSGVEFGRSFLSSGSSRFTVDESSRIKEMSSARTKNTINLGRIAKQRSIMSGTPISQGVEDLYAQFQFLNPDILGFSSFYTFRNRFCVLQTMEAKGRSFQKITGYKNMAELQQKLDGHTFRVTKDILNLPERTFVNRYVDLTPEQIAHYTAMKKLMLTQIESGEIVDGALAVTNLMRLQQILTGHLPSSSDPRGYVEIPSNRVKVLLEVLEEAQGKVIVWARFRSDVEQISKALEAAGVGYVTYTGKTTADERTEAIEAFRNNPNCRVFIGNPASGGIGLNLTVANTVVWFSMGYSLEEYLQANDRAHRIGQNQKVLYVHLIADGTVDEKVVKSLSAKKALATTVLDIREMLGE